MSSFVNKTYSLVLEYKWEPKGIEASPGTILSKMIDFQGQKVFRVGLRNEAHSSTLLFMTFGTAKLGLDNYAHVMVTGLANNLGQNIALEREEDENPKKNRSVQLYAAKFNNVMTGDLSFTFQVYIKTCTQEPHYQPQRIDDLLGLQLWSAAVSKQGTDFELVAGGRRFPVHKFILAARSPVFAARFETYAAAEGRSMSFHHLYASTLEQFLKFIYTGELVGAVSRNLRKLASDYQIETLRSLCKKCKPQEESLQDDLARLAIILKSNGNNTLEIKPDADSDINYKQNAFIFSLTWEIPPKSLKQVSFESSLVSGGFGIDSSDEMFSAKISSDHLLRQFHLFFLVHHTADKTCCSVQEVSCSLEDGPQLQLQMVTAEMNSIQMFTGSQSFQIANLPRSRRFPSKINFSVKLVSTVPTFSYRPCDSRFASKLWSAANVAKTMTDIEIIVGLDQPKSFHAHRFVLSARSPVFAAMFNSAFEEARTGVVRLSDVHPHTFTHFLKFLYTGLMPSGDNRKLKTNMFALADRYQVETLMKICRPPLERPVDVEQMMDSFLSC